MQDHARGDGSQVAEALKTRDGERRLVGRGEEGTASLGVEEG